MLKPGNHPMGLTEKTPLVSVVTPSYNQARYLETTMRSVLTQNYPKIEYIVVDGGSTDNSPEIIEKYASRLAWWVSESDLGQADAINKGFRKATGEIVAWLNSDDLYAPGAVAAAVAAFQQHSDAGLVYGNAVSIQPDGRPLNDLVFANWGLEGLAAFQIICQPAVFMRRAALQTAGLLDLSYHFLLDHHLWLRIAQDWPIQHVPEVWAFARHHPEAKNVSLASGFGAEAYRILDWMPTQPRLATCLQKNQRPIQAAAHRFNARYLLDGGQAWPALQSYLKALASHPATALQEWQRIIFAVLALIGLKQLGPLYYQIKQRRLPESMRQAGIQNADQLYPQDVS